MKVTLIQEDISRILLLSDRLEDIKNLQEELNTQIKYATELLEEVCEECGIYDT